MTNKAAVYKTKLAADLFQIGRAYQTDGHFALECFHKAVLLDPNQKYINRYVALKVRLHAPYFFNKPEDYLPNGPLVKPEWEQSYTAMCKAELAKFEINAEKDISE